MSAGIKVTVTVPAAGRILKTRTADDVLRTLVETPEKQFTVSELAELTDSSTASIRRAVNHLERLDVVTRKETPQRNYISICRERLDKPDPILAIEQSEFQEPVRAFLDQTLTALAETDDVAEIIGIVLFGSVARGDADRRSDIDLLVVVDGRKTVARRIVSDIAATLREEEFDGDRYDFQPMVETTESVRRIGDRLRQQFEEGIALHATEDLLELRREVQNGE